MIKHVIAISLTLFLAASGVPRLFAEDKVLRDPATFRINLDVKNMSILDVLRLLGEQGQVNIVASKNVQGRVTAKLQAVTVDEALAAILETNAFTFRREQGIIKVFTQQDILQQEQTEPLISRLFFLRHVKAEEMRPVLNSVKTPRGRVEVNTMANQVVVTDTRVALDEVERIMGLMDRPLDMKIYSLSYAKAQDLQSKLAEIIPKQEGSVYVDERTNSLVVRAVAETMEKIDRIIKTWDKRSRQVLIEAKIVQVGADTTRGLGISWQYNRQEGDSVAVSTSLPLAVATGGTLRVGTLSQDQYQVTLQALETASDTDVLSSPRIVVIDNTQANILVGSSEPYLTTYIDKESSFQTQETRFIDVGVKLTVTPQISDDDYVTLKIRPEVSSARRVAEVDNALAIDTTQADTVVVVADGKTIVLGGLIKETDEEIISKVPFLGDIPLLGLVFRSKTKAKTKREIIVFITPHIIHHEARIAPDLNQREQALEQALQEAVTKWEE